MFARVQNNIFRSYILIGKVQAMFSPQVDVKFGGGVISQTNDHKGSFS